MSYRYPLLALACVALAVAGWFAARQPAPADEPPKKDAPSPGWAVAFTSLDRSGATDARRDRVAALYVPAGTHPTPLLPAGPFRAVYTGTVALELKGEYTFTAAGSGKLTVTVNGAEAFSGEGDLSKVKSKPVALKRGDNVIVATYTSPAMGDAVFRLEWASEEFRHEPLGPSQVTHADDRALKSGRQMRQGRELLANLHCLHCHKADAAAWVKAGGMPELEAEAPSLADLGARLRAGWIARWLMDPPSLRPAATMPRVFADLPRGDKGKIDPRIRDAAAYLGSLGKPEKDPPEAKKEQIEAGTRLFADLGCIGCHLAPSVDDWRDDEHKRLPLRDVVSKYRPAALVAFLRQPDKHYPWVRMPNFLLSQDEAMNLAAYLRSIKPRDVFPAELKDADVAKGKKLVESAGCLSCHRLDRAPSPHADAPVFDKLNKDSLSRGCLSDKPGKAPAWQLDAAKKAALSLVLTSGKESLKHDTSSEFARRQREALRCVACHKLDGADDRVTQLKEESDGLTADLPPPDAEQESKYPPVQVRPPLTWVGEKLRPEWMTTLFAGKLTAKPRPFLKSRMPAFPRRAEMLSAGLAAEHGFAPSSPKPAEPDAKLAEVGQSLAAKSKWGCVGCHVVGKAEAVGVFEAPGVNFADVKGRLRREYFDRWLWSPTRVEPGTKMPMIYTWGKKSLLDDVLEGDSGKQIDALWQYLQTGEKIKAPE